MKRIVSLMAAVSVAGLIGCGTPTETPTDGGVNANEVSQGITSDTTWKEGTYVLKTHIFVSNGATLTIEPGTTVKGELGSSLVITQTGKINAVGTATKPIVFTSSQPEGSRKPGDWGGVVLLGKAPINVQGGSNFIEGFAAADDNTKYGGTDANHDCGKLKYARIEFAGFELVKDKELNGLTAGACGKATELDFIQVHKGADDGVEMFGGTADLKHIVVTQPDDDGLDLDFGYTGRVQYLIIQQNADVGNVGFEWDNNENNKDASPRTMPELWNATLIGTTREAGGAKRSLAMHLRRGTAGKINNVVVANFADGAVDVDGVESVTAYNNGELFIKGSIFWNNKKNTTGLPSESTDNDNGFDEAAKILEAANNNKVVDPMLEDALNLTAPNFKPKTGSVALTGTAPPAGGFFDANATFVGAIGTTDWTAGWTAYPAN